MGKTAYLAVASVIVAIHARVMAYDPSKAEWFAIRTLRVVPVNPYITEISVMGDFNKWIPSPLKDSFVTTDVKCDTVPVEFWYVDHPTCNALNCIYRHDYLGQDNKDLYRNNDGPLQTPQGGCGGRLCCVQIEYGHLYSIEVELTESTEYEFIVKQAGKPDVYQIDPYNNNVIPTSDGKYHSYLRITETDKDRCRYDGVVGFHTGYKICQPLTVCGKDEIELKAPTLYADRICGASRTGPTTVPTAPSPPLASTVWFAYRSLHITVSDKISRVGVVGTFNDWTAQWMTAEDVVEDLLCDVPPSWFYADQNNCNILNCLWRREYDGKPERDTYRDSKGIVFPPQLGCDGKGCCLSRESGKLNSITVEISKTTEYLFNIQQVGVADRFALDVYTNDKVPNPYNGYNSVMYVVDSELTRCKINGVLGFNAGSRVCQAVTICTAEQVEIQAPTETSDRICGPAPTTTTSTTVATTTTTTTTSTSTTTTTTPTTTASTTTPTTSTTTRTTSTVPTALTSAATTPSLTAATTPTTVATIVTETSTSATASEPPSGAASPTGQDSSQPDHSGITMAAVVLGAILLGGGICGGLTYYHKRGGSGPSLASRGSDPRGGERASSLHGELGKSLLPKKSESSTNLVALEGGTRASDEGSRHSEPDVEEPRDADDSKDFAANPLLKKSLPGLLGMETPIDKRDRSSWRKMNEFAHMKSTAATPLLDV